MELANKKFRNNKTGETIKVIDSFENIAILENKQKIDVRTLMDENQYTEQIDPESFFNNQRAYNSLADKIKNIPTDGMIDESITSQMGGSVTPANNESAIIMSSEEEERAELARKYGVETDNTELINRQKEAFDKILNPNIPEIEQISQNHTQSNVVEDIQHIEVDRGDRQPQIQSSPKQDDPITSMFKNVKRNVDFNISVDISDKIPRLDFIEMMEDSYEMSIIEFLSNEFTNKILSDPSIIKNSIERKIKELVYGVPEMTRGNKEKEKTTKVEKKLSAKERIKLVSNMNSVDEIDEYLKDEKAKSVISAGEKQKNKIGK